jgi:hypothetical protein
VFVQALKEWRWLLQALQGQPERGAAGGLLPSSCTVFEAGKLWFCSFGIAQWTLSSGLRLLLVGKLEIHFEQAAGLRPKP